MITNTKDLLPHETDRFKRRGMYIMNVSRVQTGQEVLGEEGGPTSRRRVKES